MSGEPRMRTIVALLVIAAGLAILTWQLGKGRGRPRDTAGTPPPPAASLPGEEPGPEGRGPATAVKTEVAPAESPAPARPIPAAKAGDAAGREAGSVEVIGPAGAPEAEPVREPRGEEKAQPAAPAPTPAEPPPIARLGGRVIAPEGGPAPGAHVLVPAAGLEVDADEDGRFGPLSVPAGALRVHAWSPGALAEPTEVELRPDREEHVELRLHPADVVRLAVVDGADRPVEGAAILLETREGQTRVVTRAGRTGPQGQLAIARPADPEAIVRVRAPLFREGSARIEGPGPVRIPLEPEVRVTVAIAGAGPAARLAAVRLIAPDGTPAAREGDWVPTAGGALAGCPGPGRYRVEVEAEGHPPALSPAFEVPAEGGAPRVEVALPAGSALRGRVLTEAGAPAAGAEVVIRRVEPGHERTIDVLGIPVEDRRGPVVARTRAGGDGAFAVEGLPAGTYRAWARAPGWAEAAADPVSLPGDAAEIAIPLAKGGIVRGNLVPGGPALVAAVREDGFHRVAAADPSGAYEIGDLPPGRYAILAAAGPPAGPPSTFPVPVRAGRAVTWNFKPTAPAAAGETTPTAPDTGASPPPGPASTPP